MSKTLKHFFANGREIDFLDDNLGYFQLLDLLSLLGCENRFANETAWTVLQHSLTVGKATEILYEGNTPIIQHGYFHDIQEAVLRDVPTPFKDYVGKAWYDMEYMVQAKIFKALGIPVSLGDDDARRLKEVDRAVTYVEAFSFYGPDSSLLDVLNKPEADVAVVATMAFMEVQNLGSIYNEYDEIRADILNYFRQIVSHSVH